MGNSGGHAMKRRASWHDYSAPGSYMITVVISDRQSLLGCLVDFPVPHIELSDFGKIVSKYEIHRIESVYPMIEVWRYCIMPDHIHMIVRVNDWLPDGKTLGTVIGGFKYGCTKAYLKLTGRSTGTIFESNYNDRFLHDNEQLERWKHYLDDNPRRLSIKRNNPEFFTVLQNCDIAGRCCKAVGNIFLLDVPDKVAVIIHRADSEEVRERLRQEWLACGERGGVIVSAAIAPREKEILREAFNRGYNIILLRENAFPMLYKPAGEAFDACAEGRLLEICPWEYHSDRRTITRAQCLELNAMAEMICSRPNREPQ